MDHETASELLDQYRAGELDPERRAALDAHLAVCDECRGTLSADHALAAATSRAVHPSSAEIVAFATSSEQLDENERSILEDHLGGCDLCRAEVSTIRQVEASLSRQAGGGGASPAVRRGRGRARPGRLLLIAAVLVLALAYPAYLGMFRLPAVVRQIGELRQENAGLEQAVSDLEVRIGRADDAARWRGSTPLQILLGAQRDQASAPAIRQTLPITLLGIDTGPLVGVEEGDKLLVEISATEAGQVIKLALAGADAKRQLAAAGVITLIVPAEDLPPGQYRLRVVLANRPDEPEIYATRFQVAESGD